VLHLISGPLVSEGGLFKNLEPIYVTSSDVTLKAEYYQIENQWSDVKIRFEFKDDSSDVWNYTDWQEISEDVEIVILYVEIGSLTASASY